ncbi:MAG: peptide-methionine (S)-S-oxide reductase MsrA [Candidatus Thermoplasmatota archaeon]|jgi:peptide-methionine (S)-S-oxide reductase|nr:peptide-methionine (S)-S-oxide reductase MsrA [Candidatus Thermoplasmatota archaeon]|tara:strand:+ start:159 stop:617 length:459 start_codon:yes stop_codon:yes gene_type:complete
MAKAMFGAGCFWGVEYNFNNVEGVNDAISGYSGGKVDNPTYEQVCTNTTDHAEVVLVDYDPDVVTYDKLLQVFWEKHDPTTLNRQGPDIGTQYRSAIFYFDDEQKNSATKSLQERQSTIGSRKIVTEITKASDFWKAEEYHQKYFEKHRVGH